MGSIDGSFQKFTKKKGFRDDYDYNKNRKKKKWKRNTDRQEKCFAELDRPDSQVR